MKNNFTNFFNSAVALFSKSNHPTVSRRSTDGQRVRVYTATSLSMPLKYAAMLLLTLTLSLGNAWGDETITWNGTSLTGVSSTHITAGTATAVNGDTYKAGTISINSSKIVTESKKHTNDTYWEDFSAAAQQVEGGVSATGTARIELPFTVADGYTFTVSDVGYKMEQGGGGGPAVHAFIVQGSTATWLNYTAAATISLTGKSIALSAGSAKLVFVLGVTTNFTNGRQFKFSNISIKGAVAAAGGDVTAPTLSSSTPANGATDVATSGTIVLTFSEAIASVDGSKFTLTGATKGTVAIDGTDATKVNVPYSGAANEATVTLATAAGAVSDASGNASAALSNISFTTVAAGGGGGDPEPTCPTSGVIYSTSVKSSVSSNQSFPASSTTEVSPTTQADITGGKMYGINGQGSAKNLIASSSGYKFCMTNNNTTFKLDLDCPIHAGDKITLDYLGGSKSGSYDVLGVWVATSNDRPGSAPACAATASSGSKTLSYIVTAGSIYENAEELYLHRATGGSTYFNNVVITRPYAITFSSAKGSAPSATTGFEIALTQITGVSGWIHTGWTANKVVKVGGSNVSIGTAMAVDATATLSDDTQFTAVWEEDIPAVDPTITFNNGAYTIGDAALNLSTLFSSNSSGAVTYSVKTAGGTSASIAGTSFTASAAGTCVVTASQAAATGYNAATADASIEVSAPSEVDGIKMVVDNALTGNFRTGRSLSDGSCTVAGISYSKYLTLGSTYTSWGPDAGPSNKYFSYTVQKKSTKFYFYLNNTGSAAKIHLYKSVEGSAAAATKEDIDVAAGTSLISYDLATTTNTEVFIGVSSTNIRFCQIVAVESGDSHLLAPAVGYAMSLNKGRLSTPSGTATTMDGLTFVVSSGYKPAYSTVAQVGTKGTHYVSFTIPVGQARQLQLTTNNTNKYTVSKTLGDDENQITPTADEAKNFNLDAGTWYINPQGSNVNITNIAFAAAPAQRTVTFKDGASTLDTKYVWSGETVSALDPAPTKSGYRFVKWQLSGADYNFSTPVTADIVLDAVWQQVWTVTFDSDGGSAVAAAVVDAGATVAKPADPTKVGYDFVEWQLSGSAYNFSSAVTANITLVATWEVAQTDASLSALSYNGNAIDVNSAEDVSGVQTYTVHLQWGSTINAALISVTKSAGTATMSPIAYNSEDKQATFQVTSGNGSVTVNYAIQFVIDAKRGTSIVKAVVSGGNQSAGFAATGIYGDKGYAILRNDKKMDTGGKFVGVKLLSGKTFAAGDKLFVVTSTAADLGYIELYEEAAGTNLIKATGVRDASAGITIPSELVGHSEFYIVRKASTGDQAWNGFVDYVEVTREMAPAVKSFKFGDDAATINEAAKTITIEVPYATDVTAMTPTLEVYGNNGATYTPTGAQNFTSPVDYVVTDAYSEFNTTYEVTVTKAAASTNANLASLAVAGYSISFDPAVTTYNVLLDFGTTVLPAITYEVADQVSPATAIKVEGGVNGATTITVTPQAGALYNKVYTINFSVNTSPKYVIYDGSTMTNIASCTGGDGSTGFSYSLASNVAIAGESVASSWNGKNYTKVIKGFKPNDNADNIVSFVVPAGYVAKVCLVGTSNSSGTERKMFIAMNASRNVADALDNYIVTSSTYDAQGIITGLLMPNTYYIGSTDAMRLYELSVQLYPIDYSREVSPKTYGTICLPNGGNMVGATLFEVAHMTYQDAQPYKVFFDEVIDGVMEAGMPYIFLPKEGATSLAVTYTDAAGVTAGNELNYNGLHGTLSLMDGEAIYGKYIFYNNSIFMSENLQNWLNENRAYIVLSEVPDFVTPLAPGRKRVSMSVSGKNTPTGLEMTNDQLPMTNKLLINGQLFILRGDKLFDATGRLVK